MYVPQYTKKLSFDQKLNEQKASVYCNAKYRIVLEERSFPLKCESNLFHLQVDCLHEQSNARAASLQLLHEKQGHNNENDVRTLAKTVVDMKETNLAMCVTQRRPSGYR